MVFKLFKSKSAPDPAQLARAKALLATLPEGAEMLALAAARGTPIEAVGRKGESSLTTRPEKISINTGGSDADVVNSLAHELRHLQQHAAFDFKRRFLLRPEEFALFHRAIEADAHAVAAALTMQLVEAGRLEARIGRDGEIRPVRRLLKLFNRAAPRKKKTPQEIYDRVSTAFHNGLRGVFYDTRSAKLCTFVQLIPADYEEALSDGEKLLGHSAAQVFNTATALPGPSARTLGQLMAESRAAMRKEVLDVFADFEKNPSPPLKSLRTLQV